VKELRKTRPRSIILGHKTIDLDARRIRTGHQEIHLTPTECSLLAYLALHLNQTVPTTELVRTLWGLDASKGVHSLRASIGSLRQKIEPNPARPEYIVTELRIGYRLQVPDNHNEFLTHPLHIL
jgi:two-component system KDP operon response regulator KdpE